MSIVMNMRWNGITKEQYDAVRELVDWEGTPAPGGQFHVAAFDTNGLRVTDVWDDAESLNTFVNTRLMPGVRQMGVDSSPEVEVYPIHALYTPAFDRKSETVA
jgi:hypothetical protein